MTKDEALKMAIEVMELKNPQEADYFNKKCDEALNACKEALEQPQPRLFLDLSNSHGNHPVNKEWQGLTDDEINELVMDTNADIYGCSIDEFVSAIEQALKEKNYVEL
jgi:hypothetical protein